MTDPTKAFAINLYAYTLDFTGPDALRHLADQGYDEFEVMMYPGHLWPAELGESGRREIRAILEDRGLRVVSVNMPNIDLNIAGASEEMRAYSLDLLSQFIELAGDLGADGVVIGPGKANPLFPMRKELLMEHFFRALDRLHPVATRAGTRLLVENMPFAFLPDASSLMAALDEYGNDDVYVIYDVANGHFIGKDPAEELREVSPRLKLVHLSDTGQKVYRHDPVGHGDVPFAAVPPVLREIGYDERPMLEIVSRNPDADLRDSIRRLMELGYG